MRTKVFLVAAGLGLYAAPAAAFFEASVDCTGGFGPNDSVPYAIAFTELSGDQADIAVAVVIEGPGVLIQKLASGTFTLDPNETKVKIKTFQLNDARDGEYTIRLVADDGVFVTSVSCLFEVQE